MLQTKKGNQWYLGMNVHAGMDKNSGLIHSVVVTAANVHNLTPTADLLHDAERVVYGDTGYQGIAKRPEMEGEKRNSEWRCGLVSGEHYWIHQKGSSKF